MVRFTLRDKTQQLDVLESHLLSTITRMHRKHLHLAVVCDRFLFHASIASKLATDEPNDINAARRPISCQQCQHIPLILDEWICCITLLKIMQYRPIYTSSRLATVGFFPFLQTVFAPFLNFIRTLLIVLCARLLKLFIAFRDLFVLRLNFLGNKLHCFLTG